MWEGRTRGRALLGGSGDETREERRRHGTSWAAADGSTGSLEPGLVVSSGGLAGCCCGARVGRRWTPLDNRWRRTMFAVSADPKKLTKTLHA